MTGSPGLLVIGDDSCLRGRGFESQRQILDEHFSHIFIVKLVMFVCWKDENKTKRGRGWPFFRSVTRIRVIGWGCNETRMTKEGSPAPMQVPSSQLKISLRESHNTAHQPGPRQQPWREIKIECFRFSSNSINRGLDRWSIGWSKKSALALVVYK